MMTFFISLTVFVVGTYFFVIPYLYDHENRINDVRAWAQAHKEWHAQAEAAPAPEKAAPADAPAAPVQAPPAQEAAAPTP
jgi:hypothetical protein